MNVSETHRMFGWSAVVCVFGFLLNLAMYKKRGKSAALLAGSFLLFGITLLLIYSDAPSFLTYLLGVVVFSLLLYDAALRIKKSGERR